MPPMNWVVKNKRNSIIFVKHLKAIKTIGLFLLVNCSLTIAQAQLRFTENKGQWSNPAAFKADLKGATLFVQSNQLSYLFYDAQQLNAYQHDAANLKSIKAHAISIEFLGGNPKAICEGVNAFSDYSNYFKGNEPSKWRHHVKSFHGVYIKELYPHIDYELLEYQGQIKYNFILHPGANPSLIQLKYKGANKLQLNNGQLEVFYRFGQLTEQAPVVYETNKDNKQYLEVDYVLSDSILSFKWPNQELIKHQTILDPVLVFSSYSGSGADNFGYTATFDSLGNAYAGGTVFDFGFPLTLGAFQMSFAGGAVELGSIGYVDRDCGILKFSKDGKSLLFSTYIGGIFNNEQPHSMVVNNQGQLMIMGTTKSADFPIGTAPAFDDTHNGLSDIFVVKLSSGGDQLLAGTFVGGSSFDGLNGDRPSSTTSPLLYNYADDFRGEIIVGPNDAVYVASTTNSIDFPTSAAFDNAYNGKQDGCVFGLSSDLNNLLFASYIGSIGDDAAYGIDLGSHGDVYVTGGSNSSSFSYSVPGLKQTNNGGRADGYLLRIDLNNLALLSYTFIGTSAYDQCYFVKTDKYGKPFVYGQTEGIMTSSASVYANKDAKMFIKKLGLNLNVIELETTFGALNKSKPDLSPTAFLVDECERIFISGWGAINFTTGFTGGGTNNMPFSTDAYQKTTDGYDFYLGVFSKNLENLQYGTYFGGKTSGSNTAHEHVDGGTSRFDKRGIIYQSVCAGCGGNSLFPTTPGVWSPQNNSSNCNNAVFKFDFENLNRKPSVKDSLYTVLATDTLSYDVIASDPDKSDSLRIVLEGGVFDNPNFPLPLPKVTKIDRLPGQNVIKAHIVWNPNCAHIGLDTVFFNVKVYDQGCPSQDSNTAKIKMLVKAPPLSLTPETACLLFSDDGSVKLSWKAFTTDKYFKYVLLCRKNPSGSVKILDTIFSNGASSFKDKPPFDPKVLNYQYYMVAYNICGQAYDPGDRINTLVEFNTPIDSTYLHYATVVNNKSVSIHWLKSQEPDFASYDIYRADNIAGQSVGYRKIKTIYQLNDTSYVDDAVEVSDKSYCYRIGINDQCSHVSKPSNDACNIVLTGQTGKLFFDLDWTPYRNWIGGVKHYELERMVDTGQFRRLANTQMLRTYNDIDLDLWWGAYYYVVKAFEGLNANGEGKNAISRSNEIRLIQPPLVFVPNAFTPNDDYSNDVWGVSHAFVKTFEMRVFNRWGEKVWDSHDKAVQWDGQTRGLSAMNDVFVWVVTYKGWDNKFYTQKGTVTVMP